jgi:hypothetical protein
LLFTEASVFDEMEPEVASAYEIHDQIQVLSVLEGIESIDKKVVFEAFQKIELIHD